MAEQFVMTRARRAGEWPLPAERAAHLARAIGVPFLHRPWSRRRRLLVGAAIILMLLPMVGSALRSGRFLSAPILRFLAGGDQAVKVPVEEDQSKDQVLTAGFSGTILLPNGQPAANLDFQMIGGYQTGVLEDGAVARGETSAMVHTDPQGRYRVNLATGLKSIAGRASFMGDIVSLTGKGWASYSFQASGGQSSAAGGTPQAVRLQEGDRVSGQVLSYPGGRPAAGVEVQVIRSLPYLHVWKPVEAMITDGAGRFSFADTIPNVGGYLVAAQAPGYGFWQEEGEHSSNTPQMRRLTLRLIRDVTVSGQALSPDGKPLANASLSVLLEGRMRPGGPRAQFGGSAKTNARGEFSYRHHQAMMTAPSVLAAPQYDIYLKAGPRASNHVTLDALRRSEAHAVFRLR